MLEILGADAAKMFVLCRATARPKKNKDDELRMLRICDIVWCFRYFEVFLVGLKERAHNKRLNSNDQP